jgi:hypothetical protein
MRLVALTMLALALSATTATGSATTATDGGKSPGGSLEIKDGRGIVEITGRGVLVGRIDKGSLEIVDMTLDDQWSPRVNGIPRGKTVGLRGKRISFYIPGGRYRIVARGTDISISVRGTGTAVLHGDPDAVGGTGSYRLGDSAPLPLPVEATKVLFGTGDGAASSSQSGKIKP